MKLRLNHIGFVVENISEYTKMFEAIGLDDITDPVANPLQKVSASFVNLFPAKDVHVEVLESADENSPITKFLKKRGPGLHHLCFEVDDIEEARDKLLEKGFKLLVPPEPCEAYDLNFKRECTVPTKAAFFMVGRLLVELFEKGR
jgi:methylmalonyl-CoA/ethylmalonyl-CoA epimerase